MRIAAVGCAIVALSVASVGAQQSDSFVSIESLRLALQKAQRPSLSLSPVAPSVPAKITRVGILTLAPPDTNGEIVKVVVPAGELTMGFVRTISSAQHRRAERKAHEVVQHVLEDFHTQRPAR